MKNYLILSFLILQFSCVFSQEREWEYDKYKLEYYKNQLSMDSVLNHMEKKWEVGLSYGVWFFNKNARSDKESPFVVLNPMSQWKLSTALHIRESISLDFSIGFQLKKEEPSGVNFIAVINGDDIEVEGYGLVVIPVELGMNYFFMKKRFRPFIGLGVGSVSVISKHIIAEGNINNGIDRVEEEEKERALFSKIKFGFDYRLTSRANFTFSNGYSISQNLENPIGGYSSYSGFVSGIGFSVVF